MNTKRKIPECRGCFTSAFWTKNAQFLAVLIKKHTKNHANENQSHLHSEIFFCILHSELFGKFNKNNVLAPECRMQTLRSAFWPHSEKKPVTMRVSERFQNALQTLPPKGGKKPSAKALVSPPWGWWVSFCGQHG